MAVCSFIGHRDVYDADIVSRMQMAVDQLVAEHETIEFLVYQNGSLSLVFFLAALRARTGCPQKVTISFVSLNGAVEEMSNQERSYFFISDRLIVPNIQEPKKNDAANRHKKMMQWIAQNSTHLIDYFYDTLHDPDRHSVKHSKIPDISLSTPETEAAILDAALLMTEKEQLIFQKMNEGCTLKEAGAVTGVGPERARQILQRGCRTIREEMQRRYGRALGIGSKLRTRTCGLFALGEATYDSLSRFKLMMDFLMSSYSVRDIFVEQPYVRSGFMFVLTSPTDFTTALMALRETHITALVRGGAISEDGDDLENVKTMLCPPCQTVVYVNRADSSDFDVIADMIERMDFCICDLSATPEAERIRKYAAQTKRTILLDMSSFGSGNGVAEGQNARHPILQSYEAK